MPDAPAAPVVSIPSQRKPVLDTLTSVDAFERANGRPPTLAERGIEPSDRTGNGADWDNAKRQFPSLKQGEDAWVEFFDRRPEVMLQLLGDIYRETKAAELREQGKAPTGRRPKSINGNLDELYKMITPQYSVEPFGEAVRELIGSRSLRAFAAKVPMNHHTLTRLMRGELKLEMWRLEQIAAAGKVQPEFFREYREMKLVTVIQQYLGARPNASIALIKRVRREIEEGRR